MRKLFLWAVCALAVVACGRSDDDPASKQSAVTDTDETGEGQQDVPPPGAEPLPADHEGSPLPGQPPDPGYAAKRQAFEQRARQKLTEWNAASLPSEEIEHRYRQLKRKMLPPQPPPPPNAVLIPQP